MLIAHTQSVRRAPCATEPRVAARSHPVTFLTRHASSGARRSIEALIAARVHASRALGAHPLAPIARPSWPFLPRESARPTRGMTAKKKLAKLTAKKSTLFRTVLAAIARPVAFAPPRRSPPALQHGQLSCPSPSTLLRARHQLWRGGHARHRRRMTCRTNHARYGARRSIEALTAARVHASRVASAAAWMRQVTRSQVQALPGSSAHRLRTMTARSRTAKATASSATHLLTAAGATARPAASAHRSARAPHTTRATALSRRVKASAWQAALRITAPCAVASAAPSVSPAAPQRQRARHTMRRTWRSPPASRSARRSTSPHTVRSVHASTARSARRSVA